MALTTIKTTYSMDPQTSRLLNQLAAHWTVSKSAALRRAIRQAARGAGVSDRLAALDAVQKSARLSSTSAAGWANAVGRERRRASTRRSVSTR